MVLGFSLKIACTVLTWLFSRSVSLRKYSSMSGLVGCYADTNAISLAAKGGGGESQPAGCHKSLGGLIVSVN